MSQLLNIADRLTVSAGRSPHQKAVVFPEGRDSAGRVAYTHFTFSQLDVEATAIARGLISLGVQPGQRLAMFVPPSLESIALTFGIFRSGAVCTLIDPGMGKANVFRCLDQCRPDGFVAIPLVHAVRRLKWMRYRGARHNIVVGPNKRRFGAMAYQQLVRLGQDSAIEIPSTSATDPAAVIFTSGSTGPPKGVLYEHGMFDAQVDLIRDRFQIAPGEVDLPGFPLFALFNIAMQVTTVIPDMDPTRPADIDPQKFIEAFENQAVSQAFGSPALWNTFGRYCDQHNYQLPQVKRILSAGAPVPNHVVERMLRALPETADIFTPYGATECLPVAAIGGREILNETAQLTAQGAGTCVGRVFRQMEVRIIAATDDRIHTIDDSVHMEAGSIGEIIVKGPVATRQYFEKPDATALAKIVDGDGFWHRMGDVGYFDDSGRLWFCGRKAHVVHTQFGPMYSVCCEAIFNQLKDVYRCALVGIGKKPTQRPAIVVEPEAEFPFDNQQTKDRLLQDLKETALTSDLTRSVTDFLLLEKLPVDTRHNVKINREQLAQWASTQL